MILSSHLSYLIEDFNKGEMESLMVNLRVRPSAKNLQESQKYIMGFV